MTGEQNFVSRDDEKIKFAVRQNVSLLCQCDQILNYLPNISKCAQNHIKFAKVSSKFCLKQINCFKMVKVFYCCAKGVTLLLSVDSNDLQARNYSLVQREQMLGK